MSLLQERMREPLHLGTLHDATVVAAVGNPACGDVITLHLRVGGDRIQAAAFESLGSAFQLATASVLCDLLVGLDVAEAKRLGPDAVLALLPDLPQHHHYLARLAIDAVRRAVWEHEHGAGPPTTNEALDAQGGHAFVLRILGNGQRWTTREVEAMAEAEAIHLPGPPVKFLSTMRRSGTIQGEMDPARKTWVWWR